jgi:hypothetical protein
MLSIEYLTHCCGNVGIWVESDFDFGLARKLTQRGGNRAQSFTPGIRGAPLAHDLNGNCRRRPGS